MTAVEFIISAGRSEAFISLATEASRTVSLPKNLRATAMVRALTSAERDIRGDPTPRASDGDRVSERSVDFDLSRFTSPIAYIYGNSKFICHVHVTSS